MFLKKAGFKKRIAWIFIALLMGTTAFAFGNDKTGEKVVLASPQGPISLQSFSGKAVLIFFGYTSCPNVCPISLATMESAFSQMAPDVLKQTQALFVTLDPQKDTIEKLTQYTEYFHPNILGVTGKPQAIAKVAKAYGVSYVREELKKSALGYVINHSADIYLVDPNGRLRKSVPHDFPPQQLRQEIETLLIQ